MIGPDLANVLGFAGMVLILAAYAYQTAVAERVNPLLQHGLNLVGAVLIVVSLTVHTNLPSLVLESVWALIALVGLVKVSRGRFPSRLRNERGVGKSEVAKSNPASSPPASGRGEL